MINIALFTGAIFVSIKVAAPQQITSTLVFAFGLHSFCASIVVNRC